MYKERMFKIKLDLDLFYEEGENFILQINWVKNIHESLNFNLNKSFL